MSSLVDAVLNSDNIDLDLAAGSRRDKSSKPTWQQSEHPSSSRPQGPPSESNGHLSDAEGFPDDEVVGPLPNRPRTELYRNVSRVVDVAGEKVQQSFEEFLESFVEEPSSSGVPPSSGITTDKFYIAQVSIAFTDPERSSRVAIAQMSHRFMG